MSREVVKPPIVEDDLIEVSDYLRQRSKSAGLQFVDAAEQTIREIADAPESFGLWQSPNPRLAGIRVRPVKGFENWLIFYRPTRTGIAVVRVLHGARDIERILGT